MRFERPVVTVGDLAQVGIGHALRQGAATADGRQTVLGTVMMLVGQNSREVADRIAAKLPDVQDALPKGMIVRTEYDRENLVDRTVATVKRTLGEGALLVAIVLLLVMGNWRAAAIVTAVIPLAFLCTIGGMVLFGVSGNLMSLGALDLGLVVHGSIVAVENALRMLRDARADGEIDAEARHRIVGEAAAQVARPVAFGVAIITLVYVPILSLGGVEGKLFHPMAGAVMLALASALVATFTIVPAVASRLLRAPAKARSERFNLIRHAERAYVPLLECSLAHPLLLTVAALAIMGVTAAIFLSMGQQFTPQLDEGAITVMVYKPVGPVALLMNNAGIGAGGDAFAGADTWRRLLDINLMGVLHGIESFVPTMIASGEPGIVIDTGSKQGITQPPGNTAYNVSKAGVKALTEGLAHSLREQTGDRVSAHLLIPGFTYTGMTAARLPEKPAAAWTLEQVVDLMLERLEIGDFYILCPDNETTREQDAKRITWSAGDLIENRPASSRWHPAWKDEFARFAGG